MQIKLKLSTGKEIELTEAELRELLGMQAQTVFVPMNAPSVQPYTPFPMYPQLPVITCTYETTCGGTQ